MPHECPDRHGSIYPPPPPSVRPTPPLAPSPPPPASRWASYYRGGSVALYVSLYALGFLLSSLGSLVGFIPIFIYISYMAIFILACYFALGTVGFLSSLWFVYKIFKAVKHD